MTETEPAMAAAVGTTGPFGRSAVLFTLALLLAAGWGALLAYSAFYLTGPRPAAESAAVRTEPTPHATMAEAVPQRDPAPTRAIPQAGIAMAPPASQALLAVPPVLPAPAVPGPAEPKAEAALVDPHPRAEKPEYVGTWGPSPQACNAQAKRNGFIQASISEDGARAGPTVCAFKERRRNGDGWIASASCVDRGRRWTSQVRLNVDGDRLTWSSAKGVSTYVRCRRQG